MEKSQVDPLQQCHVHKTRAILSRIYTLLHVLAIPFILYYRVAYFFHKNYNHSSYYKAPLLPWLMVCFAEFVVLFVWILKQSLHWRPVTRTVFPENLPKDEDLPRIDVFVCTADPDKEPTFEVMNTVVSAMCLDYPADKLSVYLSDDGGASVTLDGMKEAWVFATWWLPFCKMYNIKPICPQAYFENSREISRSSEFTEDRKIVEEKYEIFKQRVQNWKKRSEINIDCSKDHPATVQVINENFVGDDGATINPENTKMPLLVYVAREKRPSYPHHFKAGALNVLQRVSSIMSNAPYILVLDCDMYCNDSISARQAMCFYLDSKTSPSLAWVQFPQAFHNTSENDIYGSGMKTAWKVLYEGIDGLQGPILSGTNFYINRKALYSLDINKIGNDINKQRCTFGSANELIKSLSQIDKPNETERREISSEYLRESHYLASCAYEEGTQWGKQVGFRYDTVVEDVMTGYALLSQGWKSIYLNPARPQFLGSATTNLNETLVQGCRWAVGLLQMGLSKHCPLFYKSPKLKIHHRLLYAWAAFFPIDFLPISCYAIITPICFFYGIPLYPTVSDPLFIPFAFVFITARIKHLCEVYISGDSVNAWLNEQRITMIKGLTSYVYGTIDCVMAMLGLREASFIPTNKAGDDDTSKWYRIGKYDFRTSNMFLVPIVGAVILNLFGFVIGVARVINTQNWDALFAQLFFSFYVLIISFPVIEGVLLRKDNARVPLHTTLISILISWVILGLGYFIV